MVETESDFGFLEYDDFTNQPITQNTNNLNIPVEIWLKNKFKEKFIENLQLLFMGGPTISFEKCPGVSGFTPQFRRVATAADDC